MDRAHTPRRTLTLSLVGLLMLASASPPVSASVSWDVDAAQDYCTSVGGEVQERQATWNTNSDPDQWVDLGRSMEVCRFQAEDGSRIYVDLLTLYTETPTLAAAAYMAKVPMSEEPPAGNPASFYCADLGGSSQWGSGAAGGGWIDLDDPDDPVVAMCVFPDGSTIDEWGLAYHSAGTIRGADLAPLFRADTSAFPPIFGESAVAVDSTEGAAATDAVGSSTSTPPAAESPAAAGAVEALVSATSGGVVEVTSADGTVTTIAFPAGSVSEDMTVVVSPLSEPSTDKGDPLTPGVLVEQRGAEGQHMQLTSPAIITFAIPGEVPDDAAVVTFVDVESAVPLASSISRQGETTMVTAFVTSFSETTVDGDPGAWDALAPLVPDGDTTVDGVPGAGDALAPLVPDYRFVLAVSDTVTQDVQQAKMTLGADGTLTSKSRLAMTAFSGMRGRLDMSLKVSALGAALKSTKLKGEAELDEWWVQEVDRKTGTFWLRGTGPMRMEGTMKGAGWIRDDFNRNLTSDARIGVKANAVPAKVGASVPVTFTIYWKDAAFKYEATLTRVKE